MWDPCASPASSPSPGPVEQPWLRISALAAPTTTWLAAAAAVFALAGAVATRRRAIEA